MLKKVTPICFNIYIKSKEGQETTTLQASTNYIMFTSVLFLSGTSLLFINISNNTVYFIKTLLLFKYKFRLL